MFKITKAKTTKKETLSSCLIVLLSMKNVLNVEIVIRMQSMVADSC